MQVGGPTVRPTLWEGDTIFVDKKINSFIRFFLSLNIVIFYSAKHFIGEKLIMKPKNAFLKKKYSW